MGSEWMDAPESNNENDKSEESCCRRITGNQDDDKLKQERPASSSKKGEECLSDRQVAESLARLDDIKAKSTELVTEARVKAEQREAKRLRSRGKPQKA